MTIVMMEDMQLIPEEGNTGSIGVCILWKYGYKVKKHIVENFL